MRESISRDDRSDVVHLEVSTERQRDKGDEWISSPGTDWSADWSFDWSLEIEVQTEPSIEAWIEQKMTGVWSEWSFD